MKARISYGVAAIRREVRRPRSRASRSASRPDQHVGVPDGRQACSGVASTRIETSPIRKSIGWTRLVLASEKNGQDIRSCVSRSATSPGRARKFELLIVDGAAHATGPVQRARAGAGRSCAAP